MAAIDNEELEDVDLFEITDPTSPMLLAETELPDVDINAYGHKKTSHDFDVLQFPDGSWHLMVSDWDAGWIDVDVTDPSNPGSWATSTRGMRPGRANRVPAGGQRPPGRMEQRRQPVRRHG